MGPCCTLGIGANRHFACPLQTDPTPAKGLVSNDEIKANDLRLLANVKANEVQSPRQVIEVKGRKSKEVPWWEDEASLASLQYLYPAALEEVIAEGDLRLHSPFLVDSLKMALDDPLFSGGILPIKISSFNKLEPLIAGTIAGMLNAIVSADDEYRRLKRNPKERESYLQFKIQRPLECPPAILLAAKGRTD